MDVSVVCGKYNQSILHVLLSAPARMEKVEETDIVKFEKCLAAILKCDDGRLNPIINHKGPSINDVTPEGEEGGYKKWRFGVIFKA